MKINKNKYKGFGDWINNDKDFVVPMLAKIVLYTSVIVNILLLWVCLANERYAFAVLFLVLLILNARRIYKIWKVGGIDKVMPKVSANDLKNKVFKHGKYAK